MLALKRLRGLELALGVVDHPPGAPRARASHADQ